MFSPGGTQPIFLVAASSSKYSKGLMMMMTMMTVTTETFITIKKMMMMMMLMLMMVVAVVMMIMMMLMLVLMMTTTFQGRFEVFLMCSFVCLGFLKCLLIPDIFIHNIFKLCRHLGTKTYGRLPWQFCNFIYEITN